MVYKGFRFHSCVHTNHERITMARLSGERSPSRGTTSRLSAIELSGAEAGAELDTRLRSSHPRRLATHTWHPDHRRVRRGSLSVEASRECVRSVVSRSVVSRRASSDDESLDRSEFLDRSENVDAATTRVCDDRCAWRSAPGSPLHSPPAAAGGALCMASALYGTHITFTNLHQHSRHRCARGRACDR